MFPSDSDFESQFTFENAAVPLPEAPPFHALMLGNWSGDTNRADLYQRRPIVIDRDNFDEVIRKLNVQLELDLQGDGKDFLNLQFLELDDFHPDNLFRRVTLFSQLRDVRRRLANPVSFDDAAAEVRSWFEATVENPESGPEIQADLSEINDAPPIESNGLLDLILSQPSDPVGSGKKQKADNSELGRFVSKVVSPYLIKIDENEQTKLIAAVDDVISEIMRTILQHPKFQALESAWRGLFFLVRRLETDNDLKVFIFDVSKEELAENLQSVSDLTESFLYKLLLNDSPENFNRDPYTLIGGNYLFELGVDDIALLIRIAKLANTAGAPFISYIRPQLFGIHDFSKVLDSSQFKALEETKESKLWNALRSIPEAGFIALTPMRVLARMPYGSQTDSAETFSFEEFKEKTDHSKYLWMNPCFIPVLLLAQSYRLYGWEMGRFLQREVEKLPLYVYRENGESLTKPCAEIVLSEMILETILEQGFMPLISFRDSDKVRVARFQSVFLNSPEIRGKWDL
jgi:type VI secretion system protein ImpC